VNGWTGHGSVFGICVTVDGAARPPDRPVTTLQEPPMDPLTEAVLAGAPPTGRRRNPPRRALVT
ncbi:hypothetical protein PV378_41240, partial [Streptomyces scabiei]|nr:hypothetical protein [Streptomyces scabiei]